MVLGFIGLGAMGGPMATNLVKNGYEVVVSDVVQAAVDKVVAEGAVAADSQADAAQKADIIFTSLPNAAILNIVMGGEGGVINNMREGSVIVDLSSVAPATSKSLAKKAKAKNVHYVDAPVSGGVAGATKGTLTIMVGAEDEAFKIIEPVLNVLGKKIFHVGSHGAGNAIKMVNNLLLGANMAALAEAINLGLKHDLSLETMQEIIGVSSGNSYALTAKMENFIMTEDYNKGFAIDLQYKDIGLALEAGTSSQTPLPMTAMAHQVYEMARAAGMNRLDISALVKYWQEVQQEK
ncbi:MAG: NAD(P)-dependent oxidoreductase [Fastidiosipilaceae bacterium]|jgi:2-hydroxymethylglutarate dehydrogenase|nr:NAD(P)-dependent oxidoreductase [Clostridiaceae bacterium]